MVLHQMGRLANSRILFRCSPYIRIVYITDVWNAGSPDRLGCIEAVMGQNNVGAAPREQGRDLGNAAACVYFDTVCSAFRGDSAALPRRCHDDFITFAPETISHIGDHPLQPAAVEGLHCHQNFGAAIHGPHTVPPVLVILPLCVCNGGYAICD